MSDSFSTARLDASPLFETAYGSVRHCPCCDRIQVTFQDRTLLLDASYFEALVHHVAAADEQAPLRPHSGWWKLCTDTCAGEVAVLLRDNELAHLRSLLDGAAAMLELNDLLADTLGAP